jgi:hypothetical protein
MEKGNLKYEKSNATSFKKKKKYFTHHAPATNPRELNTIN